MTESEKSARRAYVMAMAILQSSLYASADDELRAAVDETVFSGARPADQ